MVVNQIAYDSNTKRTIIHYEEIPKTKWRPITKLDLLYKDSIHGRVRDNDCYEWLYLTIVAVASHLAIYPIRVANGMGYKYGEIEVPIDEKPPREAWVVYNKETSQDPWRGAWGNKKDAIANIRTDLHEIVHMIEVPQ